MPVNIRYNTQLHSINVGEYGRNVQDFVQYICTIEDKEKRTKLAEALVIVLFNLNSQIKEQNNYKHKLWDFLHIISDFKLDVNSPYPIPEKKILEVKPQKLSYNNSIIRFKFYGRNLNYLIQNAIKIEDDDLKSDYVNLIASFMYNSCKNWNNENLPKEILSEHISLLSQGKLSIDPGKIVILQDAKPKIFSKNNQNNKNNKNFKNKNKFKKK